MITLERKNISAFLPIKRILLLICCHLMLVLLVQAEQLPVEYYSIADGLAM